MFRHWFPTDAVAVDLFSAVESSSVAGIESALRKAVAEGRTRAETVNVRTPNNLTALIYAASKRQPAAVLKKLIDEGAEVNAYGGSLIEVTALHYTTGAGDIGGTHVLLEAGADPALPFTGPDGCTIECYEMAKNSTKPPKDPDGHAEVCRLLLEVHS